MTQQQHQSVLLKEAVEALKIKQDGIYVDATFGRGGHSTEILKKLNDQGKLIVLDRDPQAIEDAKKKYNNDNRVIIIHRAFSQLENVISDLQSNKKIDGVLLDLGVSSPQLDDASRGFSFMQSGVLDMRMNPEAGISAQQWVNQSTAVEMAEAFKNYGEERYAKRIANAITIAREEQTITDTLQLAEIIKQAHPRWEKHKHPATRCFQAIRIAVNQELQELATVLTQLLNIVATDGRIAIISFHSLEDRMVKQFFKKMSSQEELPYDIPIMFSEEKLAMRLIKKAIKPSNEEIKLNPRSRSAVLRVAEVL